MDGDPERRDCLLPTLRVAWRSRLRLRSFGCQGRPKTHPSAPVETPTLRSVNSPTWNAATDVKTGAGRRAVPMAFVVRRELTAHKARTGRGGHDLVFGRTATEVFYASTIRARANKAWKQADLDLGRPRRCPRDVEPLRAPRPRRRGHRTRAPRCLPDAAQNGTDCGAHCGARPPERENPRIDGGSEVPLPGFEPGRQALRPVGIECLQAFQGVSEGFFCKNWSAIGPRSEGVVDQFRLVLAGHVVGVNLCRADVLVAHPFLEGAEADLA